MNDEVKNGNDLIVQARQQLQKAARETAANKIKENEKKRSELLKQIAIIDLDNGKIISDYENGII